jgi:hypothetical protein
VPRSVRLASRGEDKRQAATIRGLFFLEKEKKEKGYATGLVGGSYLLSGRCLVIHL